MVLTFIIYRCQFIEYIHVLVLPKCIEYIIYFGAIEELTNFIMSIQMDIKPQTELYGNCNSRLSGSLLMLLRLTRLKLAAILSLLLPMLFRPVVPLFVLLIESQSRLYYKMLQK
jgi:hypothetical protein